MRFGGGRLQTRDVLRVALAGLAVAAACWAAWSLAWICDDAFISLRYAQQLVAGEGLVFNPGERVEGFTNFSWTIALALVGWLGGDPETAAVWLGLVAFAGLAALALAHGERWRRRADAGHLYLPLLFCLLVANLHVRVFATGGLETALFTALPFGAYLLVSGGRGRRSMLPAGAALGLCVLTRQDGAVFAVVLAAYLGVRREWRALALLLAPVTAMVIPFLAWRYGYYGQLLPNTFYAKSAAEPQFARGLTYAGLYFACYRFATVGALAACALLWAWLARRRAAGGDGPVPGARVGPGDIALPLAMATAYTAYVVYVGGDFMFARFLVPATPFVYAAVEIALAATPVRSARLGGGVLLVGLTLLRNDPFIGDAEVAGVVDERHYYTPETVRELREAGESLGRHFEGLPVRIAFSGMQAALVHHSRVAYALEGTTGLTDTVLARQPADPDARAGHQKRPSREYLLERGIHFYFHRAALDYGPLRPYQQIHVGDVWGRIICYDAPLMAELARRGARFTDFPTYLDRYLDAAPTIDAARRRQDLAEFQDYYFRHTDDPARLEALRRIAGGAGAVSISGD